MRQFPTMEQLAGMPLNKLRALDIRTAEEEAMVQVAVNSKVETKPMSQPNIRVPDIKTKEEEEIWQKKIDEAKEAMRPKRVSMADIVSKPEEVNIPSLDADPGPMVSVFCTYCSAKGPIKHLKNCTKPK